MLLTPTPPVAPPADIFVQAATGTSGNPLGWDAAADDSPAPGTPMYMLRYDIAKTSMAAFVALEQSYAPTVPAIPPTAETGFRDQMIWTGLAWSKTTTPTDPNMAAIMRFYANAFPAKPLTSAAVAEATPIFIRSCAHFIVEYAGDYVTQYSDPTNVNYGQVKLDTNNNVEGQDNIVDFAVDKSADTTNPPSNPSVWVKKIRWYGFPRSLSANGQVQSGPNSPDVVPLHDLLSAGPLGINAPPASFERLLPAMPASGYYTGNTTAYKNNAYVCSWGPETAEPLPKMIRITIALDDPNGRIASPQFFEYVIDLAQ